MRKKVIKLLNTVDSDSSYAAIFHDIGKRRGIDQKTMINLIILLIEEVEALQVPAKTVKK